MAILVSATSRGYTLIWRHHVNYYWWEHFTTSHPCRLGLLFDPLMNQGQSAMLWFILLVPPILWQASQPSLFFEHQNLGQRCIRWPYF